MSDNLDIYNQVREVPKEAQKKIKGGRLSGMTDINPMWRIKKLTELFGICGFGWKYEITEKRLEEGGNNEIAAFVDINLYVKNNGEWSDPIPGSGGSSFVADERKGLHTSDECFKMALTDAISIACKSLGFGANVYWDSDTTKYSKKKSSSKKSIKIESVLEIYNKNKEAAIPEVMEFLKTVGQPGNSIKEIKKLDVNQLGALLNKLNKAVK